jgi:hypothetical protein
MLNRGHIRTITLGSISLMLALAYCFSIAGPISSRAMGRGRASARTDPPGGEWLIQAITASGTGVQGRSLVMDKNGVPQVAYVTTDQVLHYATWSGSAWTDEPVSSDYAVLPPAQIALDPSGGLHIVFMTVGPSAPLVYYATRDTTWTTELVEMTASDPWLAFDLAGHPHIVFQDTRPIPPDGGGMGLVQYTKGSGGWTPETIALRNCSSACGPINIVIDKNDHIHVSYKDGDAIRYAYNGSGDWTIEEVASSGLAPFLAVDDSGNPKVAYTFPHPEVRLASKSAGSWYASLVDGEIVAGASLAFDHYNNPQLGYCDMRPIPPDGPGLGLKYAFLNGNTWEIQEVDGMTECTGAWLALDENGNPSVLYYDSTTQLLKYAQWVPAVASATLPTGGGELDSGADQTTYTFPANVFSDEVTITHTPLFPGSLPPTDEAVSIGHGFEVTATYNDTGDPAQPELGQSYSIEIQYSSEELGLVDESTLALYYWDGNTWVGEASSQVNTSTNTLTAAPNHFSIWAVLGEYHSLFLPLLFR